MTEQSDRPVLAAGRWRNNGELVADAARLYPLNGTVVDATYGKGNFWTVIRPPGLITHDLALDGVDFRSLPEADRSVSTLVLDPPYVAPGGRTTSTIHAMNEAYGMQTTEPTPDGQWQVIKDGIDEAHRVLSHSHVREICGRLWLKCQDYVSSGRQQWCTMWAHRDLETLGFDVVDRFVLVNSAGPQPVTNLDGSKRRQVHARNNLSVLFIAR